MLNYFLCVKENIEKKMENKQVENVSTISSIELEMCHTGILGWFEDWSWVTETIE